MSASPVCHYVDIAAPMDVRLDIILEAQGDFITLDAKPFAEMSVIDEMRLQRAVTFIEDVLLRAQSKRLMIEDVQRHFKQLPGFEIEHALVKAIAELMADVTADETRRIFMKKGTA